MLFGPSNKNSKNCSVVQTERAKNSSKMDLNLIKKDKIIQKLKK
jgi:hypothetical protein